MATIETHRTPIIARAADGSATSQKLQHTWAGKPGLGGWLSTVDHKEIGKRYIVTAFIFLLIGGLEALVMRVQLARPDQTLLTPEQYNQLFTMHGVTMIFLYALPVLSGFSNYLWPLMLGSRDMAFPRLNALVLLGVSDSRASSCTRAFRSAQAPERRLVQLCALRVARLQSRASTSTSTHSAWSCSASRPPSAPINFVVTLLRDCGARHVDQPCAILVWGTLTASVANLLAVPAVSLAFFLLWMDRQVGTHFFDSTAGGQPLLWQHLFWMFGHPWVYAIVLPAMGIVSDGLPVFCRRPLVGYTPVALSTVATMVLGFGVWVHHMFATGLPSLSLSFFSARQHDHRGSERSRGVRLDSHDLDRAAGVHDRVPVLRRLRSAVRDRRRVGLHDRRGAGRLATDRHLFRGRASALRDDRHQCLSRWWAASITGFPKITGRLMNEGWASGLSGSCSSASMSASSRCIFWGCWACRGAFTPTPTDIGWGRSESDRHASERLYSRLGVVLFLVNVIVSLKHGRPAGPNPWDAPTLEWSTPSPPPAYNFAVIPTVASRHPLWEDRLNERPDRSFGGAGLVLDKGRETIGTTALDAEPDVILKMPGDSIAPLLLARRA